MKRLPWRARVVLSCTLTCLPLLQACPSDANGGEVAAMWESCAPPAVDSSPRSTTLGHVIAAGKAADGTIYVATGDSNAAGENRVFVSAGDTLVRARVNGSGSSGTTDFTWSIEAEDGGSTQRLVAKLDDAGKVLGIALAPSDQKSFFDELGLDATALTPVDPSSLAKLSVLDLPSELVPEYVADVQDGPQLIVIRPRDDGSREDFRVFYGSDGTLRERDVSEVGGPRSYVTVTFSADGADYTATFGSSFAPSIESSLQGPDGTQALTLHVPPSVPAGVTFECLR